MNFAFSEEQEALRETVRKFMDDKSPSTEVRRLMETTEGYDAAVWSQMGQEMGLQGLHIPEEYGGQGFSFIELNDGSCLANLQVLAEAALPNYKDEITKLLIGSSVRVEGVLVESPGLRKIGWTHQYAIYRTG